MKEDSARQLALVRAIESADTAEALLTRDDRLYATGAALTEIESGSDRRRRQDRDSQFLERRSALAYDRLAARYPMVVQADRRTRWPNWINWLLPAAAFAFGIAANAIDGRRLSIVAFPMLGMVLWNLAVYVLLLFKSLIRLRLRNRVQQPHPVYGLVERIAGRGRIAASAQQPLGNALVRYLRDWTAWSAPLTNHRVARILHISAAAVAVGVLTGMYFRALGTEYRAGWESTLLGPQAVHSLVHFLLWPASLVTGIELPDLARIRSLQWGATGTGEHAGPWLHLYAASALLFIIVPRLILALVSAARATRLKSRFPIPGKEDFYVRRLIRSAAGDAAVVRVIPYSFHPPERARRKLERVLADVLGERTRIVVEPVIAYGTEDEWLESVDLHAQDADHLVILFNLATTPEAENHGALIAGLRRRIVEAKSGAGLVVLLDESAMRERLGEGSESRIETRRGAWESMLGQFHSSPLSLNLDDEAASLARPLEAAFLHAHAGAPA